jgi:hypothetical protein
MCHDCLQCQRGKVHKQPAATFHVIPVPVSRFSHLHVDIVGPIPASSEGYLYLLPVIDRSTQWVEAVSMKLIEARTCVDAFISIWVGYDM